MDNKVIFKAILFWYTWNEYLQLAATQNVIQVVQSLLEQLCGIWIILVLWRPVHRATPGICGDAF